jgi:endonuclease YncB( thermonuclease family)
VSARASRRRRSALHSAAGALGLAALLAVVGAAPAAAQSQLDPFQVVEGEPQVVEGDTLVIDGQTIRLYAVDAPEVGQTCRARDGREYDCGRASTNAVTNMLRGRQATCTLFSRTPDGAAVGACEVAGHDVGGAIITLGWAVSYRGLSNRYEYLESRAMTRRAGLWSGRFDRPWVWRSRGAEAQ